MAAVEGKRVRFLSVGISICNGCFNKKDKSAMQLKLF
jgi:hypothetical protein